MWKEEKEIVPFEHKLWLSSPTMHGPELEYMTEAFRTNWMSTVGKNIEQGNGINTDSEIRNEKHFSSDRSVPEQDQSDPAQSGTIEEERDSSIQDPAAQQHPWRYPMAVCDPGECWVREYIEQTGEEQGFFLDGSERAIIFA